MKPDLSRLRDIHLPPPVSWWPPAPGWWVLLGLAAAGLCFAWLLYRRRRRDRWRRSALTAVAQLRGAPSKRVLRDVSVLLRRVAISRFPPQDVAALQGTAWLAFLDRTLDDGTPFQTGAGRALLAGPYARTMDVDAGPLLDLCERWIKRLPPGGAP